MEKSEKEKAEDGDFQPRSPSPFNGEKNNHLAGNDTD